METYADTIMKISMNFSTLISRNLKFKALSKI